MNAAADSSKRNPRELWAALIVLLLGAPFVFVFARAMADAEVVRREGPLRAIIGNQAFEALGRGEKTELHYLGDGLLAPDFTLQDQTGKPWRLRDHRGGEQKECCEKTFHKRRKLPFNSERCKECSEERTLAACWSRHSAATNFV